NEVSGGPVMNAHANSPIPGAIAWVRTPGLYLLALGVLMALMQVPGLDPTGVEGRAFGQVIMVSCFLGLLVWLLGIVRRHHSQFSLRTLILFIGASAVYLGFCQVVPPHIPTLFGLAGISVLMLRDAERSRGDAGAAAFPYRIPLCRLIMVMGALL